MEIERPTAVAVRFAASAIWVGDIQRGAGIFGSSGTALPGQGRRGMGEDGILGLSGDRGRHEAHALEQGSARRSAGMVMAGDGSAAGARGARATLPESTASKTLTIASVMSTERFVRSRVQISSAAARFSR